MPLRRKNYRPRRPRRFRRRFRRRLRIHRPLRPSTYNFTRSFVENISLNNTSPPTGWSDVENGLCRSQPFTLSNLVNFAEFQNLFSQYRLLAVRQELYFVDTGSVNIQSGIYNNTGSKQILMYINPNSVGRDNASLLTENFFLQSQVCKKRVCLHGSGRPVKLYTKLRQLSQVYANEPSSVYTDYAKIKPKFISTQEANTEHYGLDVRLQRVDGSVFSDAGSIYPDCKIVTKVYLQCRQVA